MASELRTYYNDNDPFAVRWLKNLITAGAITPGDVDDRTITEVQPDELERYDRVHLFAGIGGWDAALNLSGWPADRPVWTCSCPCPPFSQAGRRLKCPECESESIVWNVGRTGRAVCTDCRHDWAADDRHLWPEAWRLIAQCGPPAIFGEQVSGKPGREWFAGVRASLEILGYSAGASDLPAGSVGAPHKRQRLFWVADTGRNGGRRRIYGSQEDHGQSGEGTSKEFEGRRPTDRDGLADAESEGRRTVEPVQSETPGSGRMGDAVATGPQGHRKSGKRGGKRNPRSSGSATGPVADTESHEQRKSAKRRLFGQFGGSFGNVGNAPERIASGREPGTGGPVPTGGTGPLGPVGNPWHPSQFEIPESPGEPGRFEPIRGPGGYWFVLCRDGKARRVEPRIFPLAHGIPARMGRLRGYGNAIVPQVAAVFVLSYMEAVE